MNTPRFFGLAIVGAAVSLALAAKSADAAFFYEYSTAVGINGDPLDDSDSITDSTSHTVFLLHGIDDTSGLGHNHIEVSAGNPIVLATDTFQGLNDTPFSFDFDFEIELTLTTYAASKNDDSVNPPMTAGSIDIFGHVVSAGDQLGQTITINGFTTDPSSGLFFSGTQPIQISGFDSSQPTFGEGGGPGSITAILSDPNDVSAPETSSLAIWGVFGAVGIAAQWVKKFRSV